MLAVLVSAVVALVIGLLGTPAYIKFLVKRGYGQFIRDDGPTSHHTKRGTPTMGGTVIIAATVVGYFVAHFSTAVIGSTGYAAPTASGVLVLFLMAGLGLVGFLDDYIKISRQRSLGLRSKQKLAGQALVAIIFAVLALRFPDGNGTHPASTAISFVRDTKLDLAFGGTLVGIALFVIWANVMISGTSNGVNLTDGLDGLATGASTMVFAAYVLIGVWQSNQNCATSLNINNCYAVRDPLDLAVVAAGGMGACFGFLWWNAAPAKIFMGDTGSLALGGALAGLAITSRTELLVIILGGLFVTITLSVIIQVASFKSTGKRVFRMAPLQHHFELKGWQEVTIVIRFWIIAGLFVAFGLGIFYAEWVVGAL
ncbi:phospho-N-acetylmuramoyl-pentapeptide-transferase [Nostocoides australiense]|mgnify:CR=1 FL=1|nr:phospho-N-acetylmuramoyl-pentapeptide-transferase [Actinomycetota bacterium]HPF79606.1 phospho-N-acetylmuramoyl-pentapeptide-transferase [Tetrasphaera australiensis]HRW00719.1 phospho-N-acetylmuramoyl-pentapeptide-transferase [Tetrasphaera sp.]